MKKLIMGVLGLASVALAFAQADKAEQARQQIEAQRTSLEAEYALALAECYSRFAVNDCIQTEKRRRRLFWDGLRRQEASLNEQERLSRVTAQREAMAERRSPEKREQAQLDREAAQNAYQSRLARAQEKSAAAIHTDSAQTSATTQIWAEDERVVAASGTGAQAIEKNRRYLEKLNEARAHRAEREKAQSEMTGTPANSLPVVP